MIGSQTAIATIATAIIIRRTENRTRGSRIILARAGQARQAAKGNRPQPGTST
jgi:hypothetical protein